MRFSHAFIERPIFAIVLSAFITIIGAAAFFTLPIAPYPEIAPPTIQITTSYPGASALVVSQTVATPIEQQINGVENMLYMSSQATGDGKLTITVTFKIGTDLDTAQVLTQNRVTTALPRLPDDVQRLGVTVKKSIPNILILVHLYSPDGSRDQLYMSNYATLHVKDMLSRLDGVGDVQVFGSRDYAMRIWLDPDKVAAYGMNAGEVVAALRAQNVQVSAGVLDQPPLPSKEAFQLNVQTLGRLHDPEQFDDIIIKSDTAGRVTRIRDVGRVELGAQDYGSNGYLDHRNAVPLLVFQQPGSNALATAQRVRITMAGLSRGFPPGLAYTIIYDPTEFISQSVHEVLKTILEAMALVVAVVILFLQTWRASVIPIVAIPISLIGTFGILAALGFSLNNLSLFGLVLAVGIVVDDAIVVVENVERNIRLGLSPRESAHRTMDEVGGALIAIALTLCAVFIPSAFLSGITGQFFRQFAVTIAASTIISCFVSLTLSPALCALLFRPHQTEHARPGASILRRAMAWFFAAFNRGFERLSAAYGRLTARLIRGALAMLVVYAALIGVAGWQFGRAPTGFIPEQDQGYLINIVQLPPGASLDRTNAVLQRAVGIIMATPGVAHAVPFAALDATTFTYASNAATIFAKFDPFADRVKRGQTASSILADMHARLGQIQDASVLTILPPPVQGIGSAGGFKMMLQDRSGAGPEALAAAAQQLVAAANRSPDFAGVFTLFSTRTPTVYADIDRERAQKLGVAPTQVFEAMQIYLGSAYINDFNYLGRTFEVVAQADGRFRRNAGDIARLKTRNASGQMVPLGTVARFHDVTGPYRVPRYDLYPAAEIMGAMAPGVASGTGLAKMEQLARQLPPGFGFEWTDLAFQQRQVGTPTLLIFAASVLFVFLVLSAQYESWKLPLAVILIVPMCLLASVTGLLGRHMDIDILAQIGFVVLVGLAAKNAILIVEFAKQAQEAGATAPDAAIQAARTRLRPILMTSFAFILGVIPLMLASGAGSEMRQSLGTAVFSGMLGVTGFGLLFTPIFYVVIRRKQGQGAALDPLKA